MTLCSMLQVSYRNSLRFVLWRFHTTCTRCFPNSHRSSSGASGSNKRLHTTVGKLENEQSRASAPLPQPYSQNHNPNSNPSSDDREEPQRRVSNAINYEQQPGAEQDWSPVLVVKNISEEIFASHLHKAFSRFGVIQAVKICEHAGERVLTVSLLTCNSTKRENGIHQVQNS